MVRIALVGCGEHSEAGHAVPLARYRAHHPNDVVLAAACDIQIERARHFCDAYGFRSAYGDIEEMLSGEQIDGCVAVVPIEKIAEIGMYLLERRIPCVVEKPLGSSPSEIKRLLAAANATRTPNMVSVNRRFMPFLNRALEWMKGKGRIQYVRCTMSRQARTEPEFMWATAVHAVDTLRYVAGEIESYRMQKIKLGTSHWYSVDFAFKNGASGRIDVLPTAGMVEEIYELFGNGFCVRVTCPFGARRGWVAFEHGARATEECVDQATEDVVNGYYNEAECFIQSLQSGSAFRPSVAEVAASVELCMSIAGM
jgi:predicted dehydrogenase